MAVAAKDSYKITLLPGDGIGPEITTAAVRTGGQWFLGMAASRNTAV
jgi:hypothetical protein